MHYIVGIVICGHHPMRKIAPTFGSVLLFVVTLFFLGPQLGSVDVDGDGVPDVPIMVMHGSDQNVQPAESDRLVVIASPRLGLVSDDLGRIERRSVVDPPGSRLDSVPPLRC